MSISTTEYADGTALTQQFPWGLFRGGRALCPDGKVRALARISATADTFFSVPAAVKAKGKTVSGYISVEAKSGSSVVTEDDPAIVKFKPYLYGRNAEVFRVSVPTEPVNVSVPKWECPICGTSHGRDYEAAKACVALGMPDGAGAAEEIVVWNHSHHRRWGGRDDDPALVLTRLGPITRGWVDDDGAVTVYRNGSDEPSHLLTYDNGMAASVGVGVKPGSVIEINLHSVRDAPEVAYSPNGGGRDQGLSGMLYRQGGGEREPSEKTWPFAARYGHAWESDYFGYPWGSTRDDNLWVSRLTDEVRQVFEVLIPDRWEKVLAVDPAADIYDERNRFRGQWRWDGVSTTPNYSTTFAFDLRSAMYAVACAHGFNEYDSIGITRWLFLHKTPVLAWLHDRFYRWVHGEDVTFPMIVVSPPVVDGRGGTGRLPKKPNKRRTEALAHWGVDPEEHESYWYRKVVEAALASITVDPPMTDLVQGVPDAVTFRSL